MNECRFYKKLDGEGRYATNTVMCELCPHCCVISEGRHGKCGSRWNFEGSFTLWSMASPVPWLMTLLRRNP